MRKHILITGATDGIGLATAKILAEQGHDLIIHGRNAAKLSQTADEVLGVGSVQTIMADLSDLSSVRKMVTELKDKNIQLDVLINNAGVLKATEPTTADGFDIRFAVNIFAPYLLTIELLPLLNKGGRVVNLSSAAQAPIDLDLMSGKRQAETDMEAYAQSKLAIAAWTADIATKYDEKEILFSAVNPGSLLASKMVQEGFGIAGNDISIGADILVRAALSDEFIGHTGDYFDNDIGAFGPAHADAMNAETCKKITEEIESLVQPFLS